MSDYERINSWLVHLRSSTMTVLERLPDRVRHMLPHQREEWIVRLLRDHGTVSANELVQKLKVSAPTVRRDLERLEAEGVLRRVHGGAHLIGAPHGEPATFEALVDEGAAEKDAIAAAAAALVQDRQVVVLDIGTTTVRIAERLRGRAVTVITNSLAVLDVLREDEAVDLVMLGGSLNRRYHALSGPLAEDALASVSGDIAFLSCSGVRPDGSVVDDMGQEAVVKRAMVRRVSSVVLVATAVKFPGTGSMRVCSTTDVARIVTSASLDEPALELARREGVEVITA
ncbi:DeoR/GlpR family DNA-binding transcription regulator [Streptomyces shenzhenensis]|uniref:DeoR/GlpR family DNA-binding transcription regulator n=2 Tax=Streptomyces shenzhenensis TaxID=943815 RepID=UPI0036A2E309